MKWCKKIITDQTLPLPLPSPFAPPFPIFSVFFSVFFLIVMVSFSAIYIYIFHSISFYHILGHFKTELLTVIRFHSTWIIHYYQWNHEVFLFFSLRKNKREWGKKKVRINDVWRTPYACVYVQTLTHARTHGYRICTYTTYATYKTQHAHMHIRINSHAYICDTHTHIYITRTHIHVRHLQYRCTHIHARHIQHTHAYARTLYVVHTRVYTYAIYSTHTYIHTYAICSTRIPCTVHARISIYCTRTYIHVHHIQYVCTNTRTSYTVHTYMHVRRIHYTHTYALRYM